MALSITRPNIPVPLTMARGGTEATTAAGARLNLGLGDVAQLTAPGGTTTFLRADKTWAAPAGGGSGDVSSNTAVAVDSELVVFSGTTGKLVRRGTGTGLALLTNGALSIKASPAGAVVGTLDSQVLTNKTITGANNSLSIREADLLLTDVTTRDVSLSTHGFVPKATGNVAQFLCATGAWATPASINYWSRSAGQVKLATAGDQLVLADTSTTFEKLEVGGGIKVGDSTGTVDGIIRWTGADLEVRKGGSWVSLTL